MKIGINRWTMPMDWTLARCFDEAKKAGFDSIEINLAEDGELTLQSTEQEVRQIAAAARDTGITLSSLSNGLGWPYPLTSNDPAIRHKGYEILQTALRCARWLEVDTILCVPGLVTSDVGYDTAYQRAGAALQDLAGAAAETQVSIGIENVWNKFLLSPLEMARFIDEIGSSWVGAYFDVGNVLLYGFPQHWIKILGPRIKKVHVKDFSTSVGTLRGFGNPLQGNVPWAAVRAALEEIGYNSFVTAEVDGYPAAPELGLNHIAESLRQVFGEKP